MLKVYLDGILQRDDGYWANYGAVSHVAIPEGTRVIALECQDTGGSHGILASTDSGVRTDSTWLCSGKAVEGWTLPGFLDSEEMFSAARILGDNGMPPWNVM